MSNRDLYIAIRRAVLMVIAAFDKRFEVKQRDG